MAKKNKSSTHKCKRMKRTQRLQSARQWISAYHGKSLVRGYKKHFGVDEVCALLELKALGKPISEERIESSRKAVQRKAEITTLKRQAREREFNPYSDVDEHLYHVVGYTSCGFAYGITWEQAEEDGLLSEYLSRSPVI